MLSFEHLENKQLFTVTSVPVLQVSPTVTQPVDSLAAQAALAGLRDINHDGVLDSLTLDNAGLVIRYGGDNGFGDPITFRGVLQYGDVNGDSAIDLLRRHEDGTVSVLWNDGFGNFDNTTQTQLVIPAGVARYFKAAIPVAADFNDDGLLDIIVVLGHDKYVEIADPISPASVGLAVHLGDGSGGFGDRFHHLSTFGSALADSTIGDFQGDGHLDVAIFDDIAPHSGGTRGLTLFRGYGDGTFAGGARIITDNLPTQPMLAFDLDGDGADEIIASTGPFRGPWG